MKVAIIDDSVSLLEHFRTLLKGLPGCEPFVFDDPVKGLRWCLDNDPDLILVDYMMPNLDGLRFIESFRSGVGCSDTPILMVTTSVDKDVLCRALHVGATDFLRKPVDRSEFLVRVRNLLKLRQSHRILTNRAEWLADEVRKVTRTLVERERETILVLSRAAEHRDTQTADHLFRMASYCRLIAEGLGLPAEDVDLIFTAAPMHDVGKIGIPDRILLKPGPLDAEEAAIMRLHPVIGRDILNGTSKLLAVAAEIAMNHHEKFDGTGYPHGLAGEAIPLSGRIAALADVFDALLTKRPYKEPWEEARAVAYVIENAGRHFDPACVAVFRDRWTEVSAIARGIPPKS